MTGRLAQLVAALVALAGFTHPTRADLPDDLDVGAHVHVEVRASNGALEALDVEVKTKRNDEDAIKGVIAAVDRERRMLRIGPLDVSMATASAKGEGVAFEELAPGQRVKAEGSFSDGVLHAQIVRRRRPGPGKEVELDLEGAVSAADPLRDTFRLLGLTIQVSPTTRIEMD